uniref:Nucleolar and spindle-associated protein 1-like isoform X1 n=1 Tax=Crassostrea virginica TaxID=6565 RepID=A0A8B8E1H9_CRAVI|nr:nucleolar and spindle-associated protein 1-like isoform X1 [Crassostrea virginica]
MDIKNLDGMKYSELQKLAKQNGIKANVKLNKLKEALIVHFKSPKIVQKEEKSTGFTSEPPPASKTTKVVRAVKTPVTNKTPDAARSQKSNSESYDSPKPESTVSSSFVTNQSTIPNEPTPEPQTKRQRRRSTFETVPTPELHTEKVPEAEHTRQSTFVVKTPQSDKKSISAKKSELKTPKKNENMTQIPRFAAFLAKRKQEAETQPTVLTPGKTKDWKKIHEKNFEKMESIDEYLTKKRKRNEDYTESVKKTKKILSDTLAMVDKLKSYKTPTGAGNPKKPFTTKTPNNAPSPFKPSVLSTKNMKLNFSDSRKSPKNSSVAKPFKPSVFSTKNMNLNFTSPAPSRKSAGSVMNKSKTTPFKFNASLNNTLNGSMSAKKPTFDLQASLARPITWKTHKGKLKPLNSNGYQTSVKTPTTQTREDRRKIMVSKRSSAKFNTTLERRGIKV